MSRTPDAVVVGAGPNGLAAAITLARHGREVTVLEAAAAPGGGCRTAALTLDGFAHDVCSSVHPLGHMSPFMRSLTSLDQTTDWLWPELAVAHALTPTESVGLIPDMDRMVAELGRDGARYRRLLAPLVDRADELFSSVLAPVTRPPRHPLLLAGFGGAALLPLRGLTAALFRQRRAPALLAGIGAHGVQPLTRPLSSAIALLMATAGHARGWPVARGGSQTITDALVTELTALGGRIECGRTVRSLRDAGPCRALLLDVSPNQVADIAGAVLRPGDRRQLAGYRHGPGVFKLDYALAGPIPWLSDACRRSATVHVGGTLEQVNAALTTVAQGGIAQEPFVIVTQPSVIDRGRAPAGQHTAWLYCHVPNGCTIDMTEIIERRLERFAPGLRDLVIGRRVTAPADLEAYNANYIGGDIANGPGDLRHTLLRPTMRLPAYTTSNRHVFMCSAATPPGAGVHGMCGVHAAHAALRGVLA